MNNRPVEAAFLRRQSHHIITNLPTLCCAALAPRYRGHKVNGAVSGKFLDLLFKNRLSIVATLSFGRRHPEHIPTNRTLKPWGEIVLHILTNNQTSWQLSATSQEPNATITTVIIAHIITDVSAQVASQLQVRIEPLISWIETKSYKTQTYKVQSYCLFKQVVTYRSQWPV
jgi:hypothetical protein